MNAATWSGKVRAWELQLPRAARLVGRVVALPGYLAYLAAASAWRRRRHAAAVLAAGAVLGLAARGAVVVGAEAAEAVRHAAAVVAGCR